MNRIITLIFFITILVVTACGTGTSTDNSGAQDKGTVSIDPLLRETANLLGGVQLATNSVFAKTVANPRYIAWTNAFNQVWLRTQQPNLELIKSWAATNLLRPEMPKTLFYPFSGPDILNALAFFPQANDYILFGMEPAGRIPRPERDSFARQMHELARLQNALADILVLNFFQTLHMEVQVSETSYSSVSGILLYFLTRAGMEVIGGRNISIDSNGSIVTNYNPKDTRLIPGVEYSFRIRPSKNETNTQVSSSVVKRVRYFSLDISDPGLRKNNNFEKFAQTLPDTITMAKSASFLMHKDFFSRIRTLVLEKSAFILQDDSAVPQRFFLNNNWEVEYYGFYDGPIPLFSNYFQRELLTNMQAKSKGRLAFSYGYDHIKGSSNLILAIKRTKTGQ